MAVLHGEPLPSVTGAMRYALDPSFPRPHIAIFAAVHGNEPSGLVAQKRLAAELRDGALPFHAGTLILVHGNPRATKQMTRSSHPSVDLNRLFDFSFVHELPRHLWIYEHERALELRPLLESIDAAIDLHSTTLPTPPFAIATRAPGSEPLAAALGLGYVTLGWDGPGLLGDKVVFAPLTQRAVPAVAVECGQHADVHAAEVGYQCLRRGLAHLGMLDETYPSNGAKRLVIRDAIKRPSQTFRLASPLTGMHALAAGETIGEDENLVVCARRACYAIMPNDRVPVGSDMLYLAIEEP